MAAANAGLPQTDQRVASPAKNKDEIIGRQIELLFKRDSIFIGGFLQLPHILQSPFGNIRGEDFLVEGFVRQVVYFASTLKGP